MIPKHVLLGLFLGILAYFHNSGSRSKTGQIQQKLLQEYDYIIVGGGTAGCVLAARLSEDQDNTVLLLEAGGEETDNPRIDMPIQYALGNIATLEQNWGYRTEPQDKACLSMHEKRSTWPRGKVLGGCTAINGMVYVKGSRHDFDMWAATGSPGWSYREVLPYFIKSEANLNIDQLDRKYHGVDGPLQLSFSHRGKVLDTWEEAGKELGYDTGDYNGESFERFGTFQSTLKAGTRWHTARAFLRPAMDRTNLHVATLTHVTKVLIENKAAVGVEFIRNSEKHQIRSKREVILSAGAIGSPHILLLSGIGPAKHLEKFKVPVVANLPVGENMEDHLMVVGPEFVFNVSASTISKAELESTWEELKYLLYKGGVKATNSLCGTAFMKSKHQPVDEAFPHLQLHLFCNLLGGDDNIRKRFQENAGLAEEVSRALHSGTEGKYGMAFAPSLMHPLSRGTIRLRSTDPLDHPAIQPNYLTNQTDIKMFIEVIKLAIQVGQTKAFKALGAELLQNHHPQCIAHKQETDAYWECFARHNTHTIFHPTSTCRMGAKDDPNTVVDSELRVKGIGKLRVADASVMPHITSGNTMAPTIMIAEKAADLICGKVTVDEIPV